MLSGKRVELADLEMVTHYVADGHNLLNRGSLSLEKNLYPKLY